MAPPTNGARKCAGIYPPARARPGAANDPGTATASGRVRPRKRRGWPRSRNLAGERMGVTAARAVAGAASRNARAPGDRLRFGLLGGLDPAVVSVQAEGLRVAVRVKPGTRPV